VESPTDWNGKLQTANEIPASCCVQNRALPTKDGKPERQQTCTQDTNDEKVYQRGCYEKLKEIVRKSAVVLMGVGLGIAFVEVRLSQQVSSKTKEVRESWMGKGGRNKGRLFWS